MAPILILAYGNPLRCDDGVAWRAADALDGKFPPSKVEILRLHQLAPEVADAVRTRELVLFIDAASVDVLENGYPGEIRIREIASAKTQQLPAGQFSHVYSPTKVLELARELYGATPKAMVITVAGENFGHGDRLSDTVVATIPALVGKIEDVVRTRLANS